MRGLKAALGKILRGLTLVLLLACTATLIWYNLLWYHDYDTLPRSPQPAVARIYPMNMHGVVAYATANERHSLRAVEDWIYIFACLSLSAVAVHDALFGRDAWKRPSR